MKALFPDCLDGLFIQADSVRVFSSGDIKCYGSFERTASELLKFESWIRAQPRPIRAETYMFPSLANRTGAGRNGLSKAFGRIMERAGVVGKVLRVRGAKGSTVKSLSFHSFRHGAASAVFKNAALKDIARRVTAHSSRGVVDRYLHQDVEAIRGATALIPLLPKVQQ